MDNDLSIWVLFLNPDDYPGQAVIREQRVGRKGIDTKASAPHVFPNEQSAFRWGSLANLGVWMDRQPDDVQSIVGAWI